MDILNSLALITSQSPGLRPRDNYLIQVLFLCPVVISLGFRLCFTVHPSYLDRNANRNKNRNKLVTKLSVISGMSRGRPCYIIPRLQKGHLLLLSHILQDAQLSTTVSCAGPRPWQDRWPGYTASRSRWGRLAAHTYSFLVNLAYESDFSGWRKLVKTWAVWNVTWWLVEVYTNQYKLLNYQGVMVRSEYFPTLRRTKRV